MHLSSLSLNWIPLHSCTSFPFYSILPLYSSACLPFSPLNSLFHMMRHIFHPLMHISYFLSLNSCFPNVCVFLTHAHVFLLYSTFLGHIPLFSSCTYLLSLLNAHGWFCSPSYSSVKLRAHNLLLVLLHIHMSYTHHQLRRMATSIHFTL